MEWCEKMMHPVQRVYFGVAARFGVRKSGLLKLQRDVSACEYEDIQIMWKMLQRSESESTGSPVKSKKRNSWKMFKWTRCASYGCASS